jgi:hypothetical protein
MSLSFLKFRPGVFGVRFGLGIVVTAISAAACTPVPDRAAHTVFEYRDDKALRDAEFGRCADDPGTLAETPDCRNAREAKRLAEPDSLRSLPPLQLPGK